MENNEPEYVAKEARYEDGKIVIILEDGVTISFPVNMYPKLAGASKMDLLKVSLTVGGRALRWESIDEDIWIADVVMRRFPQRIV